MKNLIKSKSKKAFTLAEVLITLTLVGIIASLTIPSVVNNVNNTTNVVQLKKTYATLQQAFMLLQADNGGDLSSIFAYADNGANGMNAFLSKLNYMKNCGTGSGCFPDSTGYRLLNGSNWQIINNAGDKTKAILAGGSSMWIENSGNGCASVVGNGPLINLCGHIGVDINGASGPNQFGRDTFWFWITKTGIYPKGSFNDVYNFNCNVSPGDATNSFGCAAKVLTEGAMNY